MLDKDALGNALLFDYAYTLLHERMPNGAMKHLIIGDISTKAREHHRLI